MLFVSSTSVRAPVAVSYARPIICVSSLIKGEALRSATSSLILSSMLWPLLEWRATNPACGLPVFDFTEFTSFDWSFLAWRDFHKRFLDVGVVKMGHAAVYLVSVLLTCSQIPFVRNLPVWCITTIVPGAPIVWSTDSVRIASKALPPAFRTMVASIHSFIRVSR